VRTLTPSADVITFEHVFKRIGEREILKNINLEVQRGDIFGFLGPNGAGKTTSIRIALGLLAPTSGRVSVLGRDPTDGEARRKIGFVLEIDGLYNELTAYENLDYYARIYGLSDTRRRIDENLELANLSSRAHDKVGAYSKGMRQRLALARTLLHDPELLVLDEPTAGVDPTGQIEIRQTLLNMVFKAGKTIFLSSHNLDEVQRICTHVALIHNGQMRLSGGLADIERQMGHGAVTVETKDPVPEAIIQELRDLPGVAVQSQDAAVLTLSVDGAGDVADVVHLLDSRGMRIEEVRRQEASLEDVYTAIIKEAEGA
jgi:ABC-2 type transport system ATP-binding protein